MQCVAGVVDFAVKRIRDELLPRFPNVDDVVGLEHTYGCGVAIDAPDAIVPIRTLRNITLNPNFGGEVMVVSLGCEKLQPERLLPPGTIPIVDERSVADVGANADPDLDVVVLQSEHHVGYTSMIESIMASALMHLERLNDRRRETVPASELVVGVQCGGSDAFSGVTANPAVGFCTDLLVRAGATVLFSEVTEVRDGIDQLTSRAIDADVAEAMIREMAWYDAYLQKGRVDRSANTTPGNKKGGLSNIVEKAMGSIVKSGSVADLGRVVAGREAQRQEGTDLRRHARERLHLRHAATRRRHEPARLHDRTRHALRARAVSGDQGRDAQRPGPALARSHGRQRRHDRRRQRDDRRGGLGAVSPDARSCERAQEDLGRAPPASQRAGAVQSRAGHLIGSTAPPQRIGCTRQEVCMSNSARTPFLRLGQRAAAGARRRHRHRDLSWRARRVMDSAGDDERLFLSPQSALDNHSPIRGGVPVVFPQFATYGSLPTTAWHVRAIGVSSA